MSSIIMFVYISACIHSVGAVSLIIDSRGGKDWKRAHVMLYVTPLRGISFDVGAFCRRSTMLMTSFHERTSIYRTTGTVPVTTGTRTLNCTRGYQET